jgi:hypothetical protein
MGTIEWEGKENNIYIILIPQCNVCNKHHQATWDDLGLGLY